MTRICPWTYDGGRRCGAFADWPVKYRVDAEVVTFCLNHAQREVLGGQARYYLTMGTQPITWADQDRISRDGP